MPLTLTGVAATGVGGAGGPDTGRAAGCDDERAVHRAALRGGAGSFRGMPRYSRKRPIFLLRLARTPRFILNRSAWLREPQARWSGIDQAGVPSSVEYRTTLRIADHGGFSCFPVLLVDRDAIDEGA